MVLEILGWFLLGIIALIVLVIFVVIYNGLIRLRKNVDKAWANIKVLLKQRNDEIPNLVKVAKGYMKYERKTFTMITQARSIYSKARTPADLAKSDNMLSGALKTLFAVAENYPDLKADSNFKHLQSRVSGLENEIADRREFLNDSVTLFNIRIAQIPYVFVAKPLGYKSKKLFKTKESEEKVPDIEF